MNQRLCKRLRRAARKQQPDATRSYVREHVRRYKANVGSVEIAADTTAPYIVDVEVATIVNAPGTQRRIYRDAKKLWAFVDMRRLGEARKRAEAWA